ncbi:SufD family Fe-S cluster assembly protein [Sphingomonas crocodyli]|uniref:SufD family Fe-S cluster assembly protein n=1 Tax=Sphingomonas crocodyli TaxID=1979270 RepID=A0A437M4R7_9SPHN|nr:SufD family Fe-S cluster assembly protein [Sphingomonas crocodyli]RVT92555.1 SufD family Fe-S cluster assembly protein [Sphingomonas crocodyli]
MTSLPSRHDEAWRYSDIDALARVWPIATETIHVAAGESATRQLIRNAGGDAVEVRDFAITVEAGARLDLHILNAGGAYGRFALDITLGEGAEFHLGGVQIGGGTATLEIVTVMRHTAPGAVSRQIVRSVLGDKATGTYLGKVAVARDAQHTDSTQSVKAMLLARTATANAKPELEIFADDVKCAHGAAVGELDAQALFYLMSRGIPPVEAKRLMLQAFIAEVFVDVADDAAREALEAAALSALEQLQ